MCSLLPQIAMYTVNPRGNCDVDWKWIWKLKIPAKLQFCMWFMFHNAFPTIDLRTHRGMIAMSFCPRCDETPEDLNHLFRGCSVSKVIWANVRSPNWLFFRLDEPILEWIKYNAKAKYPSHMDNSQPRYIVFVVTLWEILKKPKQNLFSKDGCSCSIVCQDCYCIC